MTSTGRTLFSKNSICSDVKVSSFAPKFVTASMSDMNTTAHAPVVIEAGTDFMGRGADIDYHLK